ncbi:hypothetical protein HRH59_18265 [Rheinheimera sp. YQF-2]|uniref:Uncharacterized protein n=1 Tax=Rheinheimera lutimaris TaxID=2740584 RepID=A0A7Y5EMQ8_9GAMM|nr:hypothetical protein [Rheinheimera lutimaris]NRQ44488.1 hypothetical protein [Rheinheimera lutimaris]
MLQTKVMITALLVVICLNGCKPVNQEPAKPLSAAELAQYKRLVEKYEPMLVEVEQYKQEAARIAEVEKSYLAEYVELKNFSIYKTNSFDDGRERPCYRGELVNNGDEIIERLELTIVFRDKSAEKVLKTWQYNLIFANDEFLNNDKMGLDLRTAVLTLEGKRLPLKPKTSFNLSQNKNCISDVFLGWSEDSTDYKLSALKLRPKLKEIHLHDVFDTGFYDMMRLENRAKQFNQIE